MLELLPDTLRQQPLHFPRIHIRMVHPLYQVRQGDPVRQQDQSLIRLQLQLPCSSAVLSSIRVLLLPRLDLFTLFKEQVRQGARDQEGKNDSNNKQGGIHAETFLLREKYF